MSLSQQEIDLILIANSLYKDGKITQKQLKFGSLTDSKQLQYCFTFPNSFVCSNIQQCECRNKNGAILTQNGDTCNYTRSISSFCDPTKKCIYAEAQGYICDKNGCIKNETIQCNSVRK